MRKHPVILSILVAALTCAATIETLASFPASASPSASSVNVRVVTGLVYKVEFSEIVQVQPGAVFTDTARCPQGSSAIGGGYILHGVDALAVASAVANYPAKSASGQDTGWATEIANPKLADGPVELEAKVVCVEPTYTEVTK